MDVTTLIALAALVLAALDVWIGWRASRDRDDD